MNYQDETEWTHAKLLDELQSRSYYSGALRQRAAVPSKAAVVAIRAELDRRHAALEAELNVYRERDREQNAIYNGIMALCEDPPETPEALKKLVNT